MHEQQLKDDHSSPVQVDLAAVAESFFKAEYYEAHWLLGSSPNACSHLAYGVKRSALSQDQTCTCPLELLH